MASGATATPKTARINDQLITLRPKETVLQAALRSGIDFPNSCRVGGCATCKCRLVEGEVKELTETGYLLSAQELAQGYILACQSVPKTHVRIDVELAKHAARRTVAGRVVARHAVTHDITRLAVQLDEPLDYRAGQFTELAFEQLPGVVRSYSFATPADGSGVVGFYIRKVPGGQLSSFVHDHDVRGLSVRLRGPAGDFWLRDGDAPLVLIAGGSGLPPILAMLQQAASVGDTRPVTLLFGAREERDLYALDQIEALQATWRGSFRFVPVLSEASSNASWTGKRGRVVDELPALLPPNAHAYLCGPPAMVDAAVTVLMANGISQEHVHFDRFTTRADASPPGVLDVFHYLKYFLFHAVGLFAVAVLLAGGWLVSAGLAAVLAFYLVGDAVSGDDTSTPTFRHPSILTAQLWLALPLLALIVFSSVWSVCSGDPLGFGRWVSAWTGYDVLAARAATSLGHHVAGAVATGLMIGMVGTIPAHELTHRTWDSLSMLVGRGLLAFSFDTSFAIEHVYGHHRYVSTLEDPATAPRGRNVYFHVLASTLQGNRSAWNIETERLSKKGLAHVSWHNAFLRGHAMSVVLVAIAWSMGGAVAAAYFVACALWGKALLEIVNYMEHYGLVRDPSTPVQPRHSWNTNRRISSWTMFNLTRHSHHHAQGEVPYHDLRPYPNAPMMIGGYLTTLVVAMIPPLWHRLMTPRVLAWDRDHATAEERALAQQANARWR
ncbi:fatty acid desaturase [Pendulispora rubella]|uniref:Fatty acid desaturase n=1 Tax=Pendulispora rubella TaxID=2741070 RepID=A0ABZ2KW12_9BACT